MRPTGNAPARTSRSYSVDEARAEFFRAVGQCVPLVFEDLAAEPLAAFQAWSKGKGDRADTAYAATRDSSLSAAVESWQRRWNLGAAWCKVKALELLDLWRELPAAWGTLLIMPGVPLSRKVIPFGSVFRLEPVTLSEADHATGEVVAMTLWPSVVWASLSWHPGKEPRSEARDRLLAWATQRIDGYLDLVQAEEMTMQPGRYHQARGNSQFKWLARYQVGGESAAKIANTAGAFRDRQTIMSAITKLASRLPLTLRQPSPGGRPRKPAA